MPPMWQRFCPSFAQSGHWMNKSSFEEILKRDGQLVYTNVGDSMLPLIRQDRDLLVIKPVSGRLRKLEIPLYRRDSGQYVLHRIMRVTSSGYVLCGDNRWNPERGITDDHIVGVLRSIVRNGKEKPVTSFGIRLYSWVWYLLYPIRYCWLRFLGLFK